MLNVGILIVWWCWFWYSGEWRWVIKIFFGNVLMVLMLGCWVVLSIWILCLCCIMLILIRVCCGLLLLKVLIWKSRLSLVFLMLCILLVMFWVVFGFGLRGRLNCCKIVLSWMSCGVLLFWSGLRMVSRILIFVCWNLFWLGLRFGWLLVGWVFCIRLLRLIWLVVSLILVNIIVLVFKLLRCVRLCCLYCWLLGVIGYLVWLLCWLVVCVRIFCFWIESLLGYCVVVLMGGYWWRVWRLVCSC